MTQGEAITTIFRGFFATAEFGVLGQAVKDGRYLFKAHDLGDYATDRHRSTDDTPYGGGAGMVMLAEPILRALEAIDPGHGAHHVLLTPRGVPLTQALARELAGFPRLVIVCGRYEGVDERVVPHLDREVSLGDFVLSGGEPAALCLLDAVARFVPGVLGNDESIADESFAHGLLEYLQYTRPREISGQNVPEVLLSGDHGAVARWRRTQALLLTRERRPDLWERVTLTKEDSKLLAQAEGGLP